MFLTRKETHKATNSNGLLGTKKLKAIINEIFEIKSIDGINTAGKTRTLDNIYITLLKFRQESISHNKYITIFSKQLWTWQFFNHNLNQKTIINLTDPESLKKHKQIPKLEI